MYGMVVYRHTKSHLSYIRLSSADEYYLLYYAGVSTSRGQTVRGLMIGSTTLSFDSLQIILSCGSNHYVLSFTPGCNRFTCTLDTPQSYRTVISLHRRQFGSSDDVIVPFGLLEVFFFFHAILAQSNTAPNST